MAPYGACEVTSSEEIGRAAGAAVDGCSKINALLVLENNESETF